MSSSIDSFIAILTLPKSLTNSELLLALNVFGVDVLVDGFVINDFRSIVFRDNNWWMGRSGKMTGDLLDCPSFVNGVGSCYRD